MGVGHIIGRMILGAIVLGCIGPFDLAPLTALVTLRLSILPIMLSPQCDSA